MSERFHGSRIVRGWTDKRTLQQKRLCKFDQEARYAHCNSTNLGTLVRMGEVIKGIDGVVRILHQILNENKGMHPDKSDGGNVHSTTGDEQATVKLSI